MCSEQKDEHATKLLLSIYLISRKKL